MEEIEFKDLMEIMASNIDTKINTYNDDQFFLFCGYEGGGKSTVSISSKCTIDNILHRKPKKEHIIFDFKEYLQAIYQHMIRTMRLENKEEVANWMKVFNYNISKEEEEELFKKDFLIQKGDIITYDEAAAEAGARRSLSSENVDQQNLLIRMRYLGEGQFYCCPKPQTLDNYPREQRPRGMFWCIGEYKINYDSFPPTIEDRCFDLYFYDKDRYLNIYKQKYWWLLFASNYDLVKRVQPSFKVHLPKDLREYIPEDIRVSYDAKKAVYNAAKTHEMWIRRMKAEKEESKSKDEFDISLLPLQGEKMEDFVRRTKRSPSAFYLWGGKKENSVSNVKYKKRKGI